MPHIRILGVSPDLVLLSAISWVLLRGSQDSLIVGLVGGVMLDMLSAVPAGASTLALTLVCYLASIGEINVFRGSRLLPYIVVAMATLLYYMLVLVLLQITNRPVFWTAEISRTVLPTLLVNVLAMPLVYAFYAWVYARTGPQRAEWQ